MQITLQAGCLVSYSDTLFIAETTASQLTATKVNPNVTVTVLGQAARNTISTFPPNGNSIHDSLRLLLGADDFPRAVQNYWNDAADQTELKFIQCTDADCLAYVTTIIENTDPADNGADIALGNDRYAR